MTIFFLCPEYKTPVGGVGVIYRHVDILNKHGIKAFVLHEKRGFRYDWFDNQTPIVYWDRGFFSRAARKIQTLALGESVARLSLHGSAPSSITAEDILVLPETYGPAMDSIGQGIPKVILNQNCYFTFQKYSLLKDRLRTPYRHPDVIATLINSQDGEKYLRHSFPDLRLERFVLSVDTKLFSLGSKKGKVICYLPRKNEEDARQVINILKFRGALGDFELRPLQNMTQEEIARNLKEAMVFLSFGHPEGFGLPAAEAMACGCLVVGYHGGGGREFFDPEFSYPIAAGDILKFAKAAEDAIRLCTTDPGQVAKMGRDASNYISEHYSREQEERELVAIWRSLINMRPD